MTNAERIETFEQPYKSKIKVNLIKHKSKEQRKKFLNSNSNSAKDTINYAFAWEDTKEGQDYWCEYYERMS